MVVWQWVQQHRWLSVLGLAVIVLGTAGGTTWALVLRTVSSPVSLKDALRLYRRTAVEPLHAPRLPAPGVYVYRSRGSEGLSIMDAHRAFPATSSMIVTEHADCATVTWAPLVQHTESTVVCPGAGGSYVVPTEITNETIGGATTRSTLACASTLYLIPPCSVHHWSAECTMSDPKEPVSVTGVALGTASLQVAGQRVPAEHVRLTIHYAGPAAGTNPTDYWVLPSSGLIIREDETVDVTQSGVRFQQSSSTRLTLLTPVTADR